MSSENICCSFIDENLVNTQQHPNYFDVSVSGVQHGLASFPGSRAGEEEREPGTHCSRMRQVPLVTCILLRCTKITVNSAYLLKGHTA